MRKFHRRGIFVCVFFFWHHNINERNHIWNQEQFRASSDVLIFFSRSFLMRNFLFAKKKNMVCSYQIHGIWDSYRRVHGWVSCVQSCFYSPRASFWWTIFCFINRTCFAFLDFEIIINRVLCTHSCINHNPSI